MGGLDDAAFGGSLGDKDEYGARRKRGNVSGVFERSVEIGHGQIAGEEGEAGKLWDQMKGAPAK